MTWKSGIADFHRFDNQKGHQIYQKQIKVGNEKSLWDSVEVK